VFEEKASHGLGMKKRWAMRRDSEAVSPIIGTILMVSVTVVLVAILFVMVVDIGDNEFTPSVMALDKTNIANGCKIALTDPTGEVKWGDIFVQLSEGTNITSWTNLTTEDLVNPSLPAAWSYGSALTLSGLHVFLNISDLAANGKINQGDYLTLTTYSTPTFSTMTTYTLVLVYRPTGGMIMSESIR
jgi:flagellin-like protein